MFNQFFNALKMLDPIKRQPLLPNACSFFEKVLVFFLFVSTIPLFPAFVAFYDFAGLKDISRQPWTAIFLLLSFSAVLYAITSCFVLLNIFLKGKQQCKSFVFFVKVSFVFYSVIVLLLTINILFYCANKM